MMINDYDKRNALREERRKRNALKEERRKRNSEG